MNVHHLSLRDLHPAGAGAALGFDDHLHRDRGAAHAQGLGEEAHQVAHEDGGVEDDLPHGHRHQPAGEGDVMMGFDRARLVDIGEDDPAEDGAQGVRVLGHQDHADGRLARPGSAA